MIRHAPSARAVFASPFLGTLTHAGFPVPVRSISRPRSSLSKCLLGLLALMIVTLGTTPRAVAQCSTVWLPDPSQGTNGQVLATLVWDPDSVGPATSVVVLGGSFTAAGSGTAHNIVTWDPTTREYATLGTGLIGSVSALATLPNGNLVAGGAFTPGGVPLNGIVQWDGTSWLSLGTGIAGRVDAMAVLPNGDLVAAFVTAAGGVGIDRWDGVAWSPLGAPVNGSVTALAVLPNGDLVAGGSFTAAGGIPANSIARWDGTAWSPLGTGISIGSPFGRVSALAVLPNGDLAVGGLFVTAGGVVANNIALWDGTSWSALGSGIVGNPALFAVTTMAVMPNGDLVVGGMFTDAGGVGVSNIARWDGASWSALGAGLNDLVNALTTLPNGDLVAAGRFSGSGGVIANDAARWDGASWSALAIGPGSGLNDKVLAAASLPSGEIVVGGDFTVAGGIFANFIARWDGTSWSALGAGMNDRVNVLTALPNGDLVAGGRFTTAGGVSASHIARWDGVAWSPFGTGMDNSVTALAVLPNGDLVAGGVFGMAGGIFADRIARWDGTTWWPLGVGLNGPVRALAVLPNGDLAAAGSFTSAGGVAANNVARWDGTSWSPLGAGLNGPGHALTASPNGDLVAGGTFTTAGGVSASRIARWDGVSWSPLGAGINDGGVMALVVLPNGDLVAGGTFTTAGGVGARQIARWNGTSWSGLGGSAYGYAAAFAMRLDGDLVVGGTFSGPSGTVATYFARLTTTCPATVQQTGAGCSGNTLTATLPWTGSTFRADASGLPSAALVFAVAGFGTTSLPLASVFTTALPGCTLHALPDVVAPMTAVGGTALFQLPLPNTPSLAGFVFHHQMVSLALDITLAVTATNALALTVGSF